MQSSPVLTPGVARRWLPCVGMVALILSQSAACATPRYLGRTTSDGTFVHRAFGLVIDLPPGSDWRVVRDHDPAVPWTLWPQRIDGPLDLDGDGEITTGELTSYEDPTVRLLSRTSTAARIDIRVTIAGPERRDVPADRLLRARQSGGQSVLRRRSVSTGYETWVGYCPRCPQASDRLVAIIDHAGFEAEAGRRRQLVTVEMYAEPLDEAAVDQLNAVLDEVLLARAAGVAPSEASP